MDNSDDQFSLKWNNFQSNLANGFHDLLQEEDMVDVTLAVEGKYVQAHKVILSVCSPYFRDLFKANPCKHPIVILKDVGHQELLDMLDFMYKGEASVRQDDLPAFLKLAETLKVKGLAGDKSLDETSSQLSRKPNILAKKKRVLDSNLFEPEDDPGDSEFLPSQTEPKRKRKRVPSPQPKTDNTSISAASTFVPIVSTKQEVDESEEVEFLDENATDALGEYIEKTKQDTTVFEESNLDLNSGDDTHAELDMTGGAGPSTADDSSEQVPQGFGDQRYKYIQSKNGKFLLLLDGFSYRKYMTSKSKHSYWKCTLRECRAKGCLSSSGVFSLTKYVHNHEPDFIEMQRKEAISQLRKLSLTTKLSIEQLLKKVGIEDDPDRKFRGMINFWRWHAKRKQESSLPSDFPDDLELNDYHYVKLDNVHYLFFRNFLYRKYMTSKTDCGSFWRCREPSCPSRLRINENGTLKSITFNHSHEEDVVDAEFVSEDIRQQVRNAALTTEMSTMEILKMFGVEDDLELKKYVKNLRTRKPKKRDPVEEEGHVLESLELLENLPEVKEKDDEFCWKLESTLDIDLNDVKTESSEEELKFEVDVEDDSFINLSSSSSEASTNHDQNVKSVETFNLQNTSIIANIPQLESSTKQPLPIRLRPILPKPSPCYLHPINLPNFVSLSDVQPTKVVQPNVINSPPAKRCLRPKKTIICKPTVEIINSNSVNNSIVETQTSQSPLITSNDIITTSVSSNHMPQGLGFVSYDFTQESISNPSVVFNDSELSSKASSSVPNRKETVTTRTFRRLLPKPSSMASHLNKRSLIYDYHVGLSRQGNCKLFVGGYGYVQRATNSLKAWVCDQRWANSACRVRAIMHRNGGLLFYSIHTHHPNTAVPENTIAGPIKPPQNFCYSTDSLNASAKKHKNYVNS